MQKDSRRICLSVIIVFVWSAIIIAQRSVDDNYVDSPQNRYALLLNQVHIYASLDSFKSEDKQLIDAANDHAQRGEFEIAIVYLEETLASLQKPQTRIIKQSASGSTEHLSVSIVSVIPIFACRFFMIKISMNWAPAPKIFSSPP